MFRLDPLLIEGILTVRLSGKLAGEDTRVLAEFMDREGLPGEIDISDLVFVDTKGAEILLRAKAEGASLKGGRPPITLLLEKHPI